LPTFDVDDAQLLATFEPQPRSTTGCYKKPFSHLSGHSQSSPAQSFPSGHSIHTSPSLRQWHHARFAKVSYDV
jgi:hypothetical protein